MLWFSVSSSPGRTRSSEPKYAARRVPAGMKVADLYLWSIPSTSRVRYLLALVLTVEHLAWMSSSAWN